MLDVLVELILNDKRFPTGVAGKRSKARVSLEVVSQMHFLLECSVTLRAPVCVRNEG